MFGKELDPGHNPILSYDIALIPLLEYSILIINGL